MGGWGTGRLVSQPRLPFCPQGTLPAARPAAAARANVEESQGRLLRPPREGGGRRGRADLALPLECPVVCGRSRDTDRGCQGGVAAGSLQLRGQARTVLDEVSLQGRPGAGEPRGPVTCWDNLSFRGQAPADSALCQWRGPASRLQTQCPSSPLSLSGVHLHPEPPTITSPPLRGCGLADPPRMSQGPTLWPS